MRRIALGGLTALLVAAPLIPSESLGEMATGCVLILACVALVAFWLTVCALMGYRSLRLDWTDLSVVVLLATVVLSGWWMAGQGNVRATINAVWQWVNAGLLYLLVRQLVRRWAEMRALCVVMVALATGLSVLAAYQVFVTMPDLVARYHADPEATLREAGIEVRAGSPERRLFQDRLESAQPLATFALTNSLAGFVAPWLILAAGIGIQVWCARPLCWRRLAAVVACCLALGFCLLLTHSRTAILASGLGLAGLAWAYFRVVRGEDRRLSPPDRRTDVDVRLTGVVRGRDWRLLLLILAMLGVLVPGVTIAGVFDWLVVFEAPKSLLFRLQYWQSTMEMISDHPWLGCGPGNFQEYYPSYKLPEASETIADPHNFLLEIWATTGTLGALIFAVFLAIVILRGFSAGGISPSVCPEAKAEGDQSVKAVWIGALVGSLAAFPAGMAVGFPPDGAFFWLGIPCGAVVVLLMKPWATDGELSPDLLVIPMLVLLVNLSAAGGISFAGVATSFWLLAALIINDHPAGGRSIEVRPWIGIASAAFGLILLAACYQTLYAPVLISQVKLSEAPAWSRQGRPDRAEALLRQAAAADGAASQPWIHLASLYHAKLLSAPSPELEARFNDAVQQAKTRNPRSFPLQRQVGNWHLALYQRFEDRKHLEAAQEAYRGWTELYPNSNFAHAQLAWTYHLLGDGAAAAKRAEVALHLDAVNPHKERKLKEQQLYGSEGAGLPVSNAEQLLQRLRNASSP